MCYLLCVVCCFLACGIVVCRFVFVLFGVCVCRVLILMLVFVLLSVVDLSWLLVVMWSFLFVVCSLLCFVC